MTYDTIPWKPGNFSSIVLLAILSTLAACSDSRGGPDQTRPVVTFRVGGAPSPIGMSFAGEVKARHETALSFRVAGKLASRPVELGDTVRKGQLLGSLDAADYKLAVQTARAQLASARAELDFTRADLGRYRELLDQRVISPPEFDRRRTALTAAKERVSALEAQLGQAVNQLDYTELRADRDGVVTAVAAETGQVLAAGQPVVTLARLDDKEVGVDIPEHRIAQIRPGQDVAVTLWADERRLKARIREIAAAADPASRTYRVRATLLEGQDIARLGMTANVWVDANGTDGVAIPLSCVFSPQQQPDSPRVWLVDEAKLTVKSVPVRLGGTLSGERIAVEGLAPGQLVVSAGVQRLAEGQKVRILPDSAGHRP
ncbi:efflux RND transporter periplasmic adaptor subunit [Methylococcus geothermalis]|uniref:Efflux RND transporter periplasmic adaptor subunit n=1 Tax=Methylococcus geothermalis TaxID=2681310 RepID=A0A858Q473_9GAMM|nr:efflux RND transporter periplasmic adaptor subunit [Methylococcus geothermalis]QJD28621.1 efflux RND transporter periplasmic adaptor subunit [Methylococcus geothermalis]